MLLLRYVQNPEVHSAEPRHLWYVVLHIHIFSITSKEYHSRIRQEHHHHNENLNSRTQVRAESETEKKGWMNSITKAIKAAGVDSESQQFAAMWSHDTKECEVCDQSFGLIRRRHHCRNCGKCVCNSCSPNTWKLEHVSSKPQRVCNMCYVSEHTFLFCFFFASNVTHSHPTLHTLTPR